MKKNIYLMYAMSFLQGMVFYASISTLYRQVWGVTMFQIMVIESVCLVLGLVLEIPWGIVADRIGYRKTMILCSVLYGVSKVVFWQATSFSGFLAERILLGVATSGLSGVDTSILYLSCGEGESQKVFGIFDSLGTAGMILATLIFSAFVGENYKLSAFFTVLTYSAAAVLPFFLTEVKNEEEQRFSWQETLDALGQTFRSPMILLFLVASGLLSETQWAVTVFLNQLQYDKCGMSVTLIGVVYVVTTIAELSSAGSDGFTQKVGEGKALLILSGATALGCFVLAGTSSPWLSVVSILMIVVACSLLGPLVNTLKNEQVHTANRATMLSMFAIVTDGVVFGADLTFGALADWNLTMTFSFGGILCTVATVLLMFWYRRTK